MVRIQTLAKFYKEHLFTAKYIEKMKINQKRGAEWPIFIKQGMIVGSGCGSVGRVVAYYIRDPHFESRHWRNFINNVYILYLILSYDFKVSN